VGNPTFPDEIPITEVAKNFHEMDRHQFQHAKQPRSNSFALVLQMEQGLKYFQPKQMSKN